MSVYPFYLFCWIRIIETRVRDGKSRGRDREGRERERVVRRSSSDGTGEREGGEGEGINNGIYRRETKEGLKNGTDGRS